VNITHSTVPPTTRPPRARDWDTIRTSAAGLSLILSPLLLTAAFVILPTTASDPNTALDVIARQPTRWYLFGLLQVLSYLLLVPATLGLVHLAHRRSPAWANVGGALAVLGAITSVADTRLWVFAQQQMATPAADRPQMVALLHRLDQAMSASLPFILGALALMIGTVVLAIGLHRSRAVPAPAAAAIGVGMIGTLAAWFAGSQPALITTSILLLAGYGWIGVKLLRHPHQDRTAHHPVHQP
jgi:Domain of unknown function (DUF4386)